MLRGIFRVDVVPDVVLGDVLDTVVVVLPEFEVSKEKAVSELLLRWIFRPGVVGDSEEVLRRFLVVVETAGLAGELGIVGRETVLRVVLVVDKVVIVS